MVTPVGVGPKTMYVKSFYFFCFFVHSMYKNLQSFVPSYGRMRCICVKMSKLAVRIISFGDRKYLWSFLCSFSVKT